MITAIAFVIAGLGACLLFILFARIRAVNNHLTLKKHRSKQEGLADFLIYSAVVDDGVIVGKNGSFMTAWLYKGDDNESSTDEYRNMVSLRINQALANLGSGWMIHVDAVRRPAPNYFKKEHSFFTDPVCAAIDEERRRLFESLGTMYEGYFVLTVTWFPPLLAQRKFVDLMFDDDIVAPDKKAQTMGLIEQFKKMAVDIESRLSMAVVLTRLRGHKITTEDDQQITHDDFLSYLNFCITGLHHPIQLPNHPMYIDSLIGNQEMYTGTIPKIGRKFIQVVAIEGFPLESIPGILTSLGELACEYRWSSRFIFMDQHEALAHLDKYRKKWRQKIRGFFDQVFNTNTGSIDQDALAMVADAEGALAEVNSKLVAVGYYTSVVVLMDENRTQLEQSARQVEKAINLLGFAARIETINTTDAFFGSLPGHGTENVRRPLLNTMNLADLLPTSSIWTGSATAPCPMYQPLAPAIMQCVTHGNTIFRLNLHVRDLGHTLIFGPTGTGKSTLLATLATQLRRYKDMSIFVFDNGMSMFPITAAIHAATKGATGLHFTIAADDDKLAFCPLQFLETKKDRGWAMEWIDTILALNGVNTTPIQRNTIGQAILSMSNTGEHLFSNFVRNVQDQDIRDALDPYVGNGFMAHLLDADHDNLSLADFNVFEINELMSLGEKFALPVLLYLFRRIERSLKGQPAAIIIDEAWLMLGHPVFRAKIKEWLKTMRKANCMVIMATQSLTDASNSGIFDVLVESTASKIFLPNIYARDEAAAALYHRSGANSRQIEILASAVPKLEYYLMSESGRRLFSLALGPLALAFVGVSDKESITTIQKLIEKFGHGWVDEWLAMRNLNLNDYLEAA